MVAFNFQNRFAGKVERGEKRQTIRKTARAKKGDNLQLYTGQRTKDCRKLMDAVCTECTPITIHYPFIELHGGPLMGENQLSFAQADGFDTPKEFFEFFRKQYGLPFEGFLTKW